MMIQQLQLKVFYLVSATLENIFLVDVSTTNITKIDRINTWLTCTNAEGYGCPSANGSNNILRKPGEDLKFWIFIRRDGSLDPPFTVQFIKDWNFEIHYEVEGPCS